MTAKSEPANDDGQLRIAAFVPNLMDESRLRALGPVVRLRSPADVAALDDAIDLRAAVVDVTAAGFDLIADAVRRRWPNAPIIGYGPHVDDAALEAAAASCTEVLPRSVFFARVARGTLID